MSAQTYLTEDAPMILDATCSYRHYWPAHATIRMDVRHEVGPDLVADAKSLPFQDEVFDSIYCDPPHLIRKSMLNLESLKQSRRLSGRYGKMNMFERYGIWHTKEEWNEFASSSLKEFARCLKQSGLLHYKIIDSLKINLETSDMEIIEDKKIASRSNTNNGTSIHFLIMRPKI